MFYTWFLDSWIHGTITAQQLDQAAAMGLITQAQADEIKTH